MKYISTLAKVIAITLVFSFTPTKSVEAFQQFPNSLAWELVSQSGQLKFDSNRGPYAVHYVQPGETVNMQVTVINRSRNRNAEMWYGASALLPEGPDFPNAHAIGLGTWDPMDHVPSFLDSSSFVINGNRFVYYDGGPINKGQMMVLDFQVKIKEGIANGTYDLLTSLVREFDEWGWRDNGHGQNHRYRSMLWKFVVGQSSLPEDGSSSIDYVTHTNNKYGFTFDYPILNDGSEFVITTDTDDWEKAIIWSVAYGGLGIGSSEFGSVSVWSTDDMERAIDAASVWMPRLFERTTVTRQGRVWTVLEYQTDNPSANVESRFISNGAVVINVAAWGLLGNSPSQTFLNSIQLL